MASATKTTKTTEGGGGGVGSGGRQAENIFLAPPSHMLYKPDKGPLKKFWRFP